MCYYVAYLDCDVPFAVSDLLHDAMPRTAGSYTSGRVAVETTETLALISDTTHAQEPPFLNTVPGVFEELAMLPRLRSRAVLLSVSGAGEGRKIIRFGVCVIVDECEY